MKITYIHHSSFLVETDETLEAVLIGHTKDSQNMLCGNDSLSIADMITAWSKHSMRSQKMIGVDQRKYIVENLIWMAPLKTSSHIFNLLRPV